MKMSGLGANDNPFRRHFSSSQVEKLATARILTILNVLVVSVR